jgi:cytochrome c
VRPDVWFVVVKDRGNRFPGNPFWGDGWGWALFKSNAPYTQTARDYKQDCLNCHVPARETDYIYTQGYPAIHDRPGIARIPAANVATAAAEKVDFRGGSAERGAAIFAETCVFCHAANSDRRKLGPSLAVVAREGRLPSGQDGSSENILNQINNGGGGMPAFAESLEAREKADLIAYLRHPR